MVAPAFVLGSASQSASSLGYHPSGEMLAVSTVDGGVNVWNLRTHQVMAGFDLGLRAVSSVAFSPSGQVLACGGHDRRLRLWEVPTWRLLKEMRRGPQRILKIAFSPLEDILATAEDQSEVNIWHSETLTHAHTYHIPGAREASAVTFDPYGNLFVGGSDDGAIALFDLSSHTMRWSAEAHYEWTAEIAAHKSEHLAASAGDDGTIRLWNTTTGEERLVVRDYQVAGKHFQPTVYSVSFHPVLPILASGCSDQTMRLWDIYTGQQLASLQFGQKGTSLQSLRSDGEVLSVAFSPDGCSLAIGLRHKPVEVFTVDSLANLSGIA